MRTLLAIVTCVLALGVALPAFAEDPVTFSLDPVFVSRFEAEDDMTAVAEQIRLQVEERLRDVHLVIPIKDVPAFDDYDAATYLRACPPGKIIGCAFVIGMRAQAEWVITGTVELSARARPVSDDVPEGEDLPPMLDVTVTYIDVAESRAVLSFSVVLDGTNDDLFAAGVSDVLDRVIQGGAELRDVRGDIEDPQAIEARRRAEAAIAAQALSELEGELGAMLRTTGEHIKAARLTVADLEAYREREASAPWDQVGMTEKRYVRFRNSGRTLVAWRDREKGRQAQILFRVSGGFGAGPYDTFFDGRWARDDQTLSVVEVESFQEVRTAGSMFGEFEVGFGILPFLDAGLTLTSRRSGYEFLFHSEVVGQPEEPEEPQTATVQTLQVGGAVTFAPMATFPARPTATAGFAVWRGTSISKVVDLSTAGEIVDLGRPWVGMLQLAAGGEADVSRYISLFARARLVLPVIGDRLQRDHTGIAALQTRGVPNGSVAPGVEGQVGLLVRARPFGHSKKGKVWRK